MTEKARIAVVLTTEPTDGGKHSYSVSIVNALSSLDPEKYELIAFVARGTTWASVIASSFVTAEMRRGIVSRVIRKIILVLPMGHSLWRRLGPWLDPVQKMMRAARPDLIFYPGNDLLAHECALPGAIPIHDLMHRYEKRFPEVSEKGLYEFRERHYRRICSYAACILVDSEVGRRHVLESYAPDSSKVHVLPYVPALLPVDTESSSVLSKLNLRPGYLFYPAQFWKHKNHEVIVRALALLKERGSIVRAVFVGSEVNSKRDLLELVNSMDLQDQITIMDFVNQQELVALYKEAGALVMPTFFGPTNIPPLEAFLLGCPVIVSGIYGMKEQLGDAALYIDPTDVTGVAEAIAMILEDKKTRDDLIKRGREHSAAWNKETFAQRLEEIINNVIGVRS